MYRRPETKEGTLFIPRLLLGLANLYTMKNRFFCFCCDTYRIQCRHELCNRAYTLIGWGVESSNQKHSVCAVTCGLMAMKERPLSGRTVDHVTVASVIDFADDHSFPEVAQHDHFAVRCTGFLKIQTAGTYDLYTNSDDGSFLYLDGEPRQ